MLIVSQEKWAFRYTIWNDFCSIPVDPPYGSKSSQRYPDYLCRSLFEKGVWGGRLLVALLPWRLHIHIYPRRPTALRAVDQLRTLCTQNSWGSAALREVEDELHSAELVNSLTVPQKTQQSEGLLGVLLQPGQQISSFSAPVKSLQ